MEMWAAEPLWVPKMRWERRPQWGKEGLQQGGGPVWDEHSTSAASLFGSEARCDNGTKGAWSCGAGFRQILGLSFPPSLPFLKRNSTRARMCASVYAHVYFDIFCVGTWWRTNWNLVVRGRWNGNLRSGHTWGDTHMHTNTGAPVRADIHA